MFDAPAPTEIASPSPSWNPIQFTDSSQRREALCNEITTLAGHLNAANYRFLKLLDEFDRHEGWAGDGIRSLAHWLNFKCGLGHLVAREKVRVARAGNVSAETNDPGANKNVSAETSGGEPDAQRPAPIRTRRATALVHIAEHYHATGGSGARPLTSSEAYQVFIHVNANDASPDNRI